MNYSKHRPGYPDEVYGYFRTKAGLRKGDQVADIGSGTGLLSQLFLAHGHSVYGVEPNDEMRAEAERLLAVIPRFKSVSGRAEETTLQNRSVDLIAAGQAFHWFDPVKTKAEFLRILKPSKHVALIWNRRDLENSPFQREYELLLERFGTDFNKVDQQRTMTDAKIADFFSPHHVEKAYFPNCQVLDRAGLQGRLLSSSYMPAPDETNYAEMLAALDELFDKNQQNGFIQFNYQTTVYHAALSS